MFPNNGEMIENAVKFLESCGYRVLSPEEAQKEDFFMRSVALRIEAVAEKINKQNERAQAMLTELVGENNVQSR